MSNRNNNDDNFGFRLIVFFFLLFMCGEDDAKSSPLNGYGKKEIYVYKKP